MGGDFASAGTASSEVKKVLKQINIDPKIIKRVVVALYEAEVNVCAHAYAGKVEVKITPEEINITITDKGPGIPNIEEAMVEGYSTASPAVREMDLAQEWDYQILNEIPINAYRECCK